MPSRSCVAGTSSGLALVTRWLPVVSSKTVAELCQTASFGVELVSETMADLLKRRITDRPILAISWPCQLREGTVQVHGKMTSHTSPISRHLVEHHEGKLQLFRLRRLWDGTDQPNPSLETPGTSDLGTSIT